MKTKLNTVLAVTIVAFAALAGCSRPNETDDVLLSDAATVEGRTNLEVRLMDAPSPYNFEMMNLDITGVSVYIEPEATGERARWFNLNTSAGTYNLLSLVNGKDALLASQFIPPGRITRVALSFNGQNSSVVVDARPYRLVPSDDQEKVVMNVDAYVTQDKILPLMLDFDVARSVILRDDAYVLRPVVRAMVLSRTGSVHGQVKDAQGSVAVFADNGIMQYTTYADRSAREFLLRGIPPGTYMIKIYYPESDHAEVHEGVRVEAGAVAEINLP